MNGIFVCFVADPTIGQEAWGALLAYNLVRLEMAEIAKENQLHPTGLSFVAAMDYLQPEWITLASCPSPGNLPVLLQRSRTRLSESLLPKQRRGRASPRVVKKVPSRYPVRQVKKP